MTCARYNWLSLWRIWRFYDGSIKAVRDHLPYGTTPSSVRDFSEHAADAVDAFRCAFQRPKPTSYERGNSARATPLVAFADANSKFFHAPDLQEILDFAKPWDRLGARIRRGGHSAGSALGPVEVAVTALAWLRACRKRCWAPCLVSP
jgi:hypothetical protein